MFIKQADLLWGLDKGFVKNLMDLSHKETYAAGTKLFREGDRADRFFLLLKGRIRLLVKPLGRHVHIVTQAGETFGWSGITGRDNYSSTGECIEKTILMYFKCNDIIELCKSDPVNGLEFFQRLAGTLGNRLINSYQVEHIFTKNGEVDSFGTGQMIDSELSS